MATKAAKNKSTGNSAKSSAKRVVGNPDKTLPYRFKPGQSGNPSGRPKRKLISDALKDALERAAKEGDKSEAEAIADAMVAVAIAGDVKAATFIRDSVEGKPMQSVRLEGSLTLDETERKRRINELLGKSGQAKS